MTGRTHHAARLPPAAEPLFMLAMDHRDSFGGTLFTVPGEPSSDQLTRMRTAKSLIFDAARKMAKIAMSVEGSTVSALDKACRTS
jgi:hypothetical protein